MAVAVGVPDDMLDARLGELLERLGTDPGEIGAGAVAAVAVSMGAALLEMAARAATDWDEAGGAVAQARALRMRGLELAVLNRAAYADARGALVAARELGPLADDHAIGTALREAAAVPLRIAQTAADTADLGVLVAGRAPADLRADAAAGVVIAEAAARAATRLVAINLAAGAEGATLAAEVAGHAARAARQVADATELV